MQLTLTNMIANAGLIGQLVLVMLLIFSISSWAVIFLKAQLLNKLRTDSDLFLDKFWSANNLDAAAEIAKNHYYSPEASLFLDCYNELDKIQDNESKQIAEDSTLKMQLSTMDILKRSVEKSISLEIHIIGKHIPILATTGSATPFIGLFGTVWGIMASFHDIGIRGSASLAVVAPGISEALVATAAGLFAAIPAVIAYNYFSNKVQNLENDLAAFSVDLLNLIERNLLNKNQ